MAYFLNSKQYPDQAHLMGGKARALASLHQDGFPIPEWVVLSPEAFEVSLGTRQLESLRKVKNFKEIKDCLEGLSLSPAVLQELEQIKTLIPRHERWAVRSSALDEDGFQHSFAGQFESFLYVKAEDMAQRIVDVWHSGFSERVWLYRKNAGLDTVLSAPAVLIQRMIRAEKSGVAFGADPISGRRGVVLISAVFGLGSALVSGEVDADTYTLDRNGNLTDKVIALKSMAHYQDDQAVAGVSLQPVPKELQQQQVLSLEDALQIHDLILRLNRSFSRPQDIEWALVKGELYLLQARPITSMAQQSDPDGHLGLWDNSNIVESYGGVTTPLTFSFALYAYEGVYRELLRILGVSKTKQLEQDHTFKHMLGLFRGRIYYNLLSWYKLLATLPGFHLNRQFMEQMMGVKESLSDELLSSIMPKSTSKARDSFDLGIAVLKLIVAYWQLPSSIKHFYKRLEQALTTKLPLESMRADELIAHYNQLETKLLRYWDAPLVNDFFAMIFYGVLKRLCENWLGDQHATLQNNLVSGGGGMISAEPAHRVMEMAQLASQGAEFAKVLAQASVPEMMQALKQQKLFKQHFDDYLAKFGERCLEELKLESPTLLDDPTLLLRSIGQLAQQVDFLNRPKTKVEHPRLLAEKTVSERLTNPWRKGIFNWVLKAARSGLRERENLRFERTRVFGHVRRVFLELGRRLYALDALEDPRDIFYLELKEILALREGTSTLINIKALVALRKAEFASYANQEVPANRFETRGLVYQGHRFQTTGQETKATAQTTAQTTEQAKGETQSDVRQGLACCPGLVKGRVCVVQNPREANMQVGDILVAKQTDPGWIMLFPAASGLLVERGSLLSHSAIVAREMSLPAVVSVTDLCQWLKTGDWVEFDGSTGIIKKLSSVSHE